MKSNLTLKIFKIILSIAILSIIFFACYILAKIAFITHGPFLIASSLLLILWHLYTYFLPKTKFISKGRWSKRLPYYLFWIIFYCCFKFDLLFLGNSYPELRYTSFFLLFASFLLSEFFSRVRESKVIEKIFIPASILHLLLILLGLSVFSIISAFIYPCDWNRIKDFQVISSGFESYDTFLDTKGNYLYILHGGNQENLVEKANLSNILRSEVIKLGKRANPQRMAYSKKRNELYVTCWGSQEKGLVVISLDNFTIRKTIPTTPPDSRFINIDITPDEKFIILLGERNADLLLYSTDNLRLIRRSKGFSPVAFGLAYHEKRKSIFQSSWIYTCLSEVDLESFKKKNKIFIGFSSFEIEVEQKSGDIYVARPLNAKIEVFDGKSLKKKYNINAGYGVIDFQIIPEQDLIVCGNYLEGTVEFISLSKRKKIAKFYVGKFVKGIYYDALRRELFAVSKCGVLKLKQRFNNKFSQETNCNHKK